MKIIYIIDILGKHCGMDYYDNALCDNLKQGGYHAVILSNYSNKRNSSSFFKNVFNKPKLVGIFFLIFYFVKTAVFMLFHKKAAFIYLSYGERYDQLLLHLCHFSKHFFVDLHEVHALKYPDTSKYAKRFLKFFENFNKVIIYHSDRTKDILLKAGFIGKLIYVPHFKYTLDVHYNENHVDKSIKEIFDNNKIKFLFFGNIRKIKGIQVVLDIFNDLSLEMKEKVVLIIAGMNVEHIEINLNHRNFHLIDRHISDDELKFLYSKTDYVLLPYLKSSQSGILEMAIKFRKPMILSDIPYFRQEYDKCPSFGYLSNISNMKDIINTIIRGGIQKNFYTQKDLDTDNKEYAFIKFKNEFSKDF